MSVDQRHAGPDSPDHADADHLGVLGYRQELHRGLSPFASFASGFSFVSILTTVFQLFIIGFGFGGPAYIWTWPVVFVGQFCVCLVFAELAARYPIAGAIYQWSRRVASDPWGWMAGWLMQLGYVVSVAAIAIALQAVLPEVWSGFQIVGGDPSPTSDTGALNAIVLGTICIAVCVAVQLLGVTRVAIVTRIGVTLEIVGLVLVVVALFAHAQRGPQVVFETNGVQGDGSYLWPFLASMLMAAYVMYGFDSAAELSEETGDPRRTTPRAIVRCMVISGVGGLLLILAALMAAPDLASPDLASQGIAWVVTSELGDVFGRVVLAVVAASILSAALAISTSASRVMFSMARDGQLPFSAALAKVSPRTRTPVLPTVVVGVLAIAVLLVNLGQSSVFASVTSISVVIVYLAYLFVTVPRLYHRLARTGLHEPEPGTFSLGRWGLPVNLVAVLFGIFLLVNVGWPRAAVYDPDGSGGWVLQYSAVLAVVVILALGLVAYRVMRRQNAARAAA
ncbi:amino acid permease [Actinomycetospora sp. NBRC 106378]|uniref:amino acid permease n=1 Tax=Actinomycetospora sp. NBRC 106378 TaxID=3032208 RepID=UPI0025537091|nr:amino acid permease [Actinomycetospora sp. NBRC 106378]